MSRRQILQYIVKCPVCKATEQIVYFRLAGDDPGDPAELINHEPATSAIKDANGRGVYCECWDTGFVDHDAYEEAILKAATDAHLMCATPRHHRPTQRWKERVGR